MTHACVYKNYKIIHILINNKIWGQNPHKKIVYCLINFVSRFININSSISFMIQSIVGSF